ncbi:MAG: ATP-binding protein [Desulfuromonadaceae bacterium]
MRSAPLKTQYIFGICSLILFVSLALLLYVRGEFNKQLEKELHKRGASIARNLAEASIKPIITENYIALQLLINDLKRNEDDIRYIYIVTKHQQVVVHTFSRGFPRDLLKLDRVDMNTVTPLIQTLQTEQGQLEDVSVAIQQSDFGRVHIGISEEMLKADQQGMVLNGAPFIGLILLIGSIGAWLFASKITRPIVALSNNVKKVTAGQLDVVSAVTSHDEIGELTSAFNVMTADLKKKTEQQQQIENKLRMQAALLEEEVADRQMAQEELSVKQCQLETLNSSLEKRIDSALTELRTKDRVMLAQGRQAAMGEMINNIAHQWRQPLNNLGLIVQNIKTDYDLGTLTPEVLTGDVAKVMNTIMFMSQTINDFSNFFRPDNTKKIFCISQSLAKVVAMIEASLSIRGIRLVIEQTEEGVAVEGYFNEYNQVLLNLLNNAKDALLGRGVEQPVITVSISSVDGQAVVRVRDNAGGIPDTIIGQIFDPYFTTKKHGTGSGIGLYMSKNIITEHFGGSLTASNVADGAQFTINTPHA